MSRVHILSGLFVNLSLLYLNSPPQFALVATKSRVSCGFLAMASDCWKMSRVKYSPSLLNTWKIKNNFCCFILQNGDRALTLIRF